MAGTLTVQKIMDGSRNVIIKGFIAGDADLSDVKFYDASAYVNGTIDISLMKVIYEFNGLGAQLIWDADTDVPFLTLGTNQSDTLNFRDTGSLYNNAGTGKTGDILITTTGMAAGDTGTITLYIKKRGTHTL